MKKKEKPSQPSTLTPHPSTLNPQPLPLNQPRADASEKSTKIAYSVIMKSANYPHANLANLAKGASLRPRLSASPPTRMSVGCDDCRFIGTKECCLQPFQPDGKLRAFCDAVFA